MEDPSVLLDPRNPSSHLPKIVGKGVRSALAVLGRLLAFLRLRFRVGVLAYPISLIILSNSLVGM